jgi:hypothetical protein
VANAAMESDDGAVVETDTLLAWLSRGLVSAMLWLQNIVGSNRT